MFTRQHYTNIAAVIKAEIDRLGEQYKNAHYGQAKTFYHDKICGVLDLSLALSHSFAEDNKAFDRMAFKKACGLTDNAWDAIDQGRQD